MDIKIRKKNAYQNEEINARHPNRKASDPLSIIMIEYAAVIQIKTRSLNITNFRIVSLSPQHIPPALINQNIHKLNSIVIFQQYQLVFA